jgi:hypothetical protein
MAISDYRLDPFLGTFNIKAISGETHTIPTSSPFTVRLNEVPQKTDPSTLVIKFSGGTALTEVAAQPSQGQFWPDYSTTAHGVDDWNTGTILFNSADAGKKIVVNYQGLGTLTDARLPDMLEMTLTGSYQPEREAYVLGMGGSVDETLASSGSGNKTSYRYGLRTKTGIGAGTYTLRQIIQNLVNLSHTQYYTKQTIYSNCNCDCGSDE